MDSLAPVAMGSGPPVASGRARSKALRAIVVALPLLFGASRAFAGFEVLPLQQRVHDADAVVVGTVVGSTASWDQGRIVSDVVVDVRAAFKGRTASRIHLREPGGKVGTIGAWVSTAPQFHVGDESVLFVTRHGQEPQEHFHVVDGRQGKIDVVRDAAGRETVTWLEAETGRPERTSLTDLAERIHRIVLQEAP